MEKCSYELSKFCPFLYPNDNDDDDNDFFFVVWLTDEKHLVLFPAGTIVRDPHHR